MEVDTEASTTDLRGVARVFWRRKWWVAVPATAALVVSLLSSARAPELYASSSAVSIGDPVAFATTDFAISRPYQTPERAMATQLQLVESEAVSARAQRLLGASAAAVSDIDASGAGETDVIYITATSTDPEVAAAAANTWARAYIESRQDQAVSALNDKAAELRQLSEQANEEIAALEGQISDLNITIASIEGRIAAAGPQGAAIIPAETRADLSTATSKRSSLTSQRDALTQQVQSFRGRIDQLEVAAALQEDTGTQLISSADAPAAPFSPTPQRDAAVALAIGLLLGVGLALGREAIDDRIGGADELERAAPGVGVLGTTPRLGGRWPKQAGRLPAADAPQSAAAEAFRALRTSVEFAAVGNDASVLLITSASGREGKTTVSANLSVSFAQAGYDVVVVDLDLRRPRLADVFGTPTEPGVTDVLRGMARLDDALYEMPAPGGRLRVLPAGALPPNPAELLGSDRMRALVEHLRQTCDIVILDSPPVLAVTDPIVAARWADGLLLVARAGVTTARRLVAALDQVQSAAAPTFGVILNGARSGLRSRYHYQYYRLESRPSDVEGDWERVVAPDDPASAEWRSWVVSPVGNGNGHANSSDLAAHETAETSRPGRGEPGTE